MFTLNCKGRLLTIDQPIVMGIINVTPDSFYEGSRKNSVTLALAQAEKMIAEGATILDIGAQSTRPGSEIVGPEAEISRLSGIIEAISKAFPDTLISVDTFYSEVARQAADMGASMINDISGGNFDKAMLATVAALKTPYICMHVAGDAHSMHKTALYKDLVTDVMDYFIERMGQCHAAGISDIILDPGFGFSKTPDQNFQLIRNTSSFVALGKPVLIGVSRKSTIYKTLGISADEALNGSTVLHTAALLSGAHIIRAHDVKEAMEAIKLTHFLKP